MDDKPLTMTQRNVLSFIRSFIAEHGYSPSTLEIGRATGLSSTNSVFYQLSKLEQQGYITRRPGACRSIRLVAA